MDFFTLWDRDVEEVTSEGIHTLGGFIDFAECAARYQQERGGDGKCVGECRAEGNVKYILFYSERIYTRIAFEKEPALKALFTKKTSDRERFQEMRRKIEAAGYRLSEIA
ncbi:MAG: hypothetical protein IJI53_03165 [Clostridia bacterium]|nr:hypothetical protein [Clostridia bacterium]MBR0407017.1 hypothetical protein [Clostridia bacterium]